MTDDLMNFYNFIHSRYTVIFTQGIKDPSIVFVVFGFVLYRYLKQRLQPGNWTLSVLK